MVSRTLLTLDVRRRDDSGAVSRTDERRFEPLEPDGGHGRAAVDGRAE